ncbi:hypothetical protein HK104_002728 [Borealophlyctis nickersoniae]|nr:hypothetical protein HK104_002728 [Borealophlyctis nickersoniae]
MADDPADALKTLEQIFPFHDSKILRDHLTAAQGNLGDAIDALVSVPPTVVILEDESDEEGNAKNEEAFHEREIAMPGARFQGVRFGEGIVIDDEERVVEREREVSVVNAAVLIPDKDGGNAIAANPEAPQQPEAQPQPDVPPPVDAGGPPAPTQDEISHQSLIAMFPDAAPKYLFKQLRQHDSDVERAIDAILKLEGKYPKRTDAAGSGSGSKRRLEDDDVEDGVRSPQKKVQKDYAVVDFERPPSSNYAKACVEQLRHDFPTVPAYYIGSTAQIHNNQYTPTRLAIEAMLQQEVKPFQHLKCARHIKPKTKDKDLTAEIEAFKERAAAGMDAGAAVPAPAPANAAEVVEEEGDVECGCCYADYVMEKMTQCDDGHLFCLECARRAAENLIGLRKTEIKCIDSSDCKFLFPLSEIKRFLPEKVFEGYMRMCQEENIRKAGMADFESCPFCPFGIIMTTSPDEDKLFHCRSEECGMISCRKCKKANHVPLSCEEAAKDAALDVRHKIEEAMTEALLRECPKCKNKFYKTEGCNKMTCNCGQTMCYVCRQPIKDYNHFNQLPGGAANPKGKNLCPLWDDANVRNAQEVANAAQVAAREMQEQNPEVDAEHLKVDVPVVPPAQVIPGAIPAGGVHAAFAGRPIAVPRNWRDLHLDDLMPNFGAPANPIVPPTQAIPGAIPAGGVQPAVAGRPIAVPRNRRLYHDPMPVPVAQPANFDDPANPFVVPPQPPLPPAQGINVHLRLPANVIEDMPAHVAEDFRRRGIVVEEFQEPAAPVPANPFDAPARRGPGRPPRNAPIDAEQRAEQARQRVEQMRQRAEQMRQRAEQARERADQARQRADQVRQRAEQARQRVEQQRQRQVQEQQRQRQLQQQQRQQRYLEQQQRQLQQQQQQLQQQRARQ